MIQRRAMLATLCSVAVTGPAMANSHNEIEWVETDPTVTVAQIAERAAKHFGSGRLELRISIDV